MASHISILNEKEDKDLIKVKEKILKDFNEGKIIPFEWQSLPLKEQVGKYKILSNLMSYGDYCQYKINEDDKTEQVYILTLYINDTHEMFEIHIADKKNLDIKNLGINDPIDEVIEIFLVK